MRIKTLAGKDIVLIAAKHNLRELAAELGADSHIDASKIKNNIVLAGRKTAAGVAGFEAELLASIEFTRAMRKNTVRAIELIFSLPAGTDINYRDYFTASTAWASGYYGLPVLSSVIHLDESHPHCHVLLLPAKDGKMQGSSLVGGRQDLAKAHDDYFKRAAEPFGLSRPSPQKRLGSIERKMLANRIIKSLQNDRSALNQPMIKDALFDLIQASPQILADCLGIKSTATKDKLNPIGKEAPKPYIGKLAKNDHSLCSDRESNCDHPKTELSTANYHRQSDNNHPAESWDWETGSHIQSAIVRNRQTVLNESECVTWH
jgi:hypothetical protein